MTAIRIPHKQLQPSEKRYEDGTSVPAWDVYLDGALLASEYASQSAALLELDLAAWYAMFADAALTASIPVSDEALGLAMQVFNRLFGAEKVQDKARLARDKIIKPGVYSISADGSLSVLASSGKGAAAYTVTAFKTPIEAGQPAPTYQVSMNCECRDFYARAHEHAGICKHVATWMLLHLAQRGVGYLKHLRDALDATPNAPGLAHQDVAPAERPMAFAVLGGTDLAATLFLASHATGSVDVRIDYGQLRLVAGPIDVSYPCLDGDEAAALRLPADAFSALYERLRPVATRLGPVTVFITPSDGSLVLCTEGDTFSASAYGQPIVSLSPAPAPGADVANTVTPMADALYELFALLETHEPEWYQRRHYRLAHTALHRAGRLA